MQPLQTLDIAMTAALRPNVLVRTLASLQKNLRYNGELRLVVDIAPVPLLQAEKELVVCKQREIVDLVSFYFPRNSVRCLMDSLQADALYWTWATATSAFVLQWEDDWELECPLDLHSVMKIFQEPIHPPMGAVCFDRVGKSVKDHPGYEGQFERRGEWLWERIQGKSLGGPPALMSREYVEAVLPILDRRTCLDLLSRCPQAQTVLAQWTICTLVNDGRGYVRDIGKQWKEAQGIRMKKNTARGVTWIPTRPR